MVSEAGVPPERGGGHVCYDEPCLFGADVPILNDECCDVDCAVNGSTYTCEKMPIGYFIWHLLASGGNQRLAEQYVIH